MDDCIEIQKQAKYIDKKSHNIGTLPPAFSERFDKNKRQVRVDKKAKSSEL
jgi:hypothetical protein